MKADFVAPGIQSLKPYEPGKPEEELARELGISGAVKLASNENALGASPRGMAALSAAVGQVHRYPDAAGFRLRERLAQRLGVTQEEILLGNGSNELLELVMRTFCTQAHHVVFAHPSFVVYRMASLVQGVPFTAVPLDADLRHDLDAMAGAITEKTRVVYIANPNNPTGTYVGQAALERFLGSVPADVIVVMDEAYLEYADAPDHPDSLKLRGLHENLVTVRTFSKAYGLAALRVGYAVLPAQLCDYVNRVRAPFNVNHLAQCAALAALDDTEFLARTRELNLRERRRVAQRLAPLVKRVVPSQANFLYVELGRDARTVYDQLLRRGVIVRCFEPQALRITIGLESENDRMLEALHDILG